MRACEAVQRSAAHGDNVTKKNNGRRTDGEVRAANGDGIDLALRTQVQPATAQLLQLVLWSYELYWSRFGCFPVTASVR